MGALSELFGWKTAIQGAGWQLMTVILGPLLTRLWLAIFRVPLSPRREAAFWALSLATFGCAVSLVSYFRRYASKPRLIGRVDHITMIAHPDRPVERSLILLIANLRNKGAPTIAESWAMTIQPAGSPTITPTEFKMLPANVQLLSAGQRTILPQSENLYDKAMRPIARGDLVRGHLMFEAPLPKDAIARPGTIFRVSCHDVDDKQCRFDDFLLEQLGHSLAEGGFAGYQQLYIFEQPRMQQVAARAEGDTTSEEADVLPPHVP